MLHCSVVHFTVIALQTNVEKCIEDYEFFRDFTSADKSYLAYPYLTRGIDEKELQHVVNTLVVYGPRQGNLVLIAYASSKGSGEPAHPRSLARTFAARSYKQ